MKKSLSLMFALIVSIGCYAQQSSPSASTQHASKSSTASKPAQDSDAAKVAEIRKLLELTGTRDMVNQMKTVLMDQFRRQSPNLPGEMFQEMLTEMRPEDLEDAIIPIYLKYFTADDLHHLVAFYESPFGKKVTRVMPQIMQESNEVGMDWGEKVVLKVATKWRKEGKLTQREYEQLVGEEEHPH